MANVFSGQDGPERTAAWWPPRQPPAATPGRWLTLARWLPVTGCGRGARASPAWPRCCTPSGATTPTPRTPTTPGRCCSSTTGSSATSSTGTGHAAAPRAGVTLLPPHVVHDGRPATSRGFRKRVVYLDGDVVDPSLIGAAVDAPLHRPTTRCARAASGLDRALVRGDDLEAESRLALVVERLDLAPARTTRRRRHRAGARGGRPPGARAARRRPVDVEGIAAVAAAIGVSTAHLVRSFTRSYGIPPHRYLLGRRLDLARRRLLAGEAPVDGRRPPPGSTTRPT